MRFIARAVILLFLNRHNFKLIKRAKVVGHIYQLLECFLTLEAKMTQLAAERESATTGWSHPVISSPLTPEALETP